MRKWCNNLNFISIRMTYFALLCCYYFIGKLQFKKTNNFFPFMIYPNFKRTFT